MTTYYESGTLAVRNTSSAGAVFAGARFNKISPRMRCSAAI